MREELPGTLGNWVGENSMFHSEQISHGVFNKLQSNSRTRTSQKLSKNSTKIEKSIEQRRFS